MDLELYKAAMEGNIEVLRQHPQLGDQLTPRINTVLHVAAQFQDSRECVNEILIRKSSLLMQVNSKGETALHIAARRGCSVTVQELLAFANNLADPESNVAVTKELLRMATFEEKDTALHEAVRNNHLGVVELLLGEDPDLSYAAANSAGETPLYLAAEGHHHEIVSAILGGGCQNQAYGGPNERTALHAAVIAQCSSCVKNLLDRNQDLIKIGDSYGWTPLHFAVRFNLLELTENLLDTDKSIAYLAANKDGKMTALHLAARCDNSFDMMELFWLRCPDCWEMVNKKGQNILHIAIENRKGRLIKNLLKSPLPISNLLNEKDRDGNTPLHLLATSYISILELIWHLAVDKGAFNKKNQTPMDIALSSEGADSNEDHIKELINANAPSGRRNIATEDEDRLEKLRRYVRGEMREMDEQFTKAQKTLTLVATLIATVTFAASFTVPGGFDSNQGSKEGMAVLVRKAAFKAFVMSNTIAVTFSISALVLLSIAFYYQNLGPIWQHKAFKRRSWGWNCLLTSLVAMMVSLMTGSFAVLATSRGLAIAVCVIGCLGFLIFWTTLGRMSLDTAIHVNIKLHRKPRYRWSVSQVVRGIVDSFT